MLLLNNDEEPPDWAFWSLVVALIQYHLDLLQWVSSR